MLELKAAGAIRAGAPVVVCGVCGDDKFFVQKDFDQRIGCLILAIGALFVPWTYGLSLALVALADLALYHRLDRITVCYVCGARYRKMPIHADHKPFDLMAAQTWEARGIAWRRANDRSNRPDSAAGGPAI